MAYLEDLGGVHGAQGVSGEVAKQARAPVHILMGQEREQSQREGEEAVASNGCPAAMRNSRGCCLLQATAVPPAAQQPL